MTQNLLDLYFHPRSEGLQGGPFDGTEKGYRGGPFDGTEK